MNMYGSVVIIDRRYKWWQTFLLLPMSPRPLSGPWPQSSPSIYLCLTIVLRFLTSNRFIAFLLTISSHCIRGLPTIIFPPKCLTTLFTKSWLLQIQWYDPSISIFWDLSMLIELYLNITYISPLNLHNQHPLSGSTNSSHLLMS
jgi:hypothetical protein